MSSFLAQVLQGLIELQGWIRQSLTAYLDAFAASRDWLSLAAVLPVGIVFGAVHALTPGHSKTVLATYLVGSRLPVLRSTLVAAVLALTHVASAVIIALVALPLVTRTLVGVGRVPVLDLASRSLLALVGAWLIFRAFRREPHRHDGEGLAVGVFAGLIPCPLTLLVMVLALSRGVPEAGITFAASMMLGVTLTLGIVAVLTVLLREQASSLAVSYGAPVAALRRTLDLVAGLLLLGLAALELSGFR